MNRNPKRKSSVSTATGSRFPKPIVVISECLEFAACRYDGARIPDRFVARLMPYVVFIPICPEVRIGLGVPRDPINIYQRGKNHRLEQPSTGKDITDDMSSFAESFLDSLDLVDGFILKSRSPSCGIKDVKIRDPKNNATIGKGTGFFGRAVIEKYGDLAVEDEGRLTNFRIREHFLTRLFATASFREISKKKTMKALVGFHSDNKLLLMAYNQTVLRHMGRIVANHDKLPITEVLDTYRRELFNAFRRSARYTSNINVVMHALGYFKKHLTSREKSYFLDSIEKYREERIPLSVLLGIIQVWIAKYEIEYLSRQTFFEPYPMELVEITDSGKGRSAGRQLK